MSATVLEGRDIHAAYGSVRVLHGVSVTVNAGEVVGVLGTNGAGKSTLMGVLAGTLAPRPGSVLLHGDDVTRRSTSDRVRRGLALVPEGRRLFADLTVEENLLAGGIASGSRRSLGSRLDEVFELFPTLGSRRGQIAATLSGGEQQMVAVGRGLMSNPTVLLLDEPSLGLAPLVVRDVFEALRRLNQERGLSMLVVEQNPLFATDYAQRTYVLQSGAIVDVDAGAGLSRDSLRQAYLGVGR